MYAKIKITIQTANNTIPMIPSTLYFFGLSKQIHRIPNNNPNQPPNAPKISDKMPKTIAAVEPLFDLVSGRKFSFTFPNSVAQPQDGQTKQSSLI